MSPIPSAEVLSRAREYQQAGCASFSLGQLTEAVAAFEQALELHPDYAEAHNNLGLVLQEQGQFARAEGCYRQARHLKPDRAEPCNNLGTALREQGKLDEAVACFRHALSLWPDYADCHYNLGLAFQHQNQWPDAIASFGHAVRLNPDNAAAVGGLVHALQHICQWDELEQLSRQALAHIAKPIGSLGAPMAPFNFLALPVPTSAEQQLQCARHWAARYVRPGAQPLHAKPDPKAPKITLGYLSADFRDHVVGHLVVDLLASHARDRFNVFAYSYGPDDGSALRRRIVDACDRFTDLREISIEDSARHIAADKVDILVDLTGYTANARMQILAYRPAPIQVSYLGYSGTMGTPFVDYVLVDEFIVPPDQQPYFAEKLVYLPGCFMVNHARRSSMLQPLTRAEYGLPDHAFVFCCFNNSFKFTPLMFDVWMDILKDIPGSVLWVAQANEHAVANLRREAEARGVSGGRLTFAPRGASFAAYLARYQIADLFLDTFPYTAHATAADSLWAGCPVLTLAGETFASRVAGSLLRAFQLPELITTSVGEYRETAFRLARNRDALRSLRGRVEAGRDTSGLFDARRATRSIEEAYVRMWKT